MRKINYLPKFLLIGMILAGISVAFIPQKVFTKEAPTNATLQQQDLDQLLAPIALYPDQLLSQILMAATYPTDIVLADRWLQDNKNLKGDNLAKALEKQNWDPSVKSLINFPDILAMMNKNLEWTQQLGAAFLNQQQDVMNTVQKLRQKAEEAGNLKSTPKQRVKTVNNYIIVEPVYPDEIYIPYYDPYSVYGPWWYPGFPPYNPFGVTGFYFGSGIAIGVAWGYAWGGFNWPNNNFYINLNQNYYYNRFINRANYAPYYQIPVSQWKNAGPVNWHQNPAFRTNQNLLNNVSPRQINPNITNLSGTQNLKPNTQLRRFDESTLKGKYQGTNQLNKNLQLNKGLQPNTNIRSNIQPKTNLRSNIQPKTHMRSNIQPNTSIRSNIQPNIRQQNIEAVHSNINQGFHKPPPSFKGSFGRRR